MSSDDYKRLKKRLILLGYGGEIEWAENLVLCRDPGQFGMESCWVILNSGFRESVARPIWERKIRPKLLAGDQIGDSEFRGRKQRAINCVWFQRGTWMAKWETAGRTVDSLTMMPYIGSVTKFHLAKNLGVDCVKPDRHLWRLANQHDTTPAAMGKRLYQETGDRLAVVDTVLWRGCEQGLI